ncbi:MAG: HAMP domain-containing sensor histidine kinase [Helicobacteraceae bacterium]|nr:HAMP domain-containing sensor histidine kinase [Helicobacteraceae bacterium]
MTKEKTKELLETVINLSRSAHPDVHQNVLLLSKQYMQDIRFRTMLVDQNTRYNEKLQKQEKELARYKYELTKLVKQETEEHLKNEKILQQQAKMAAMGEMMDAVAHQWKQPLNALSMFGQLLQMDFEEGTVDKVYVDNLVKDSDEQIEHMISTLTEFRTFFRPDKEAEPFGLKRCIQTVMLLMKDELIRNQIEVHVESEKEVIINGIENEFKHLILNIIANAKDAFVERERKQRAIYIRFYKENGNIILKIEDNAGGIADDIIKDIFKPNITSKEDGTGIGLYLSAQIAQKLNGQLYVANTERGAEFTLEVHPCCN